MSTNETGGISLQGSGPNGPAPLDPELDADLRRRASGASLAVALILSVAKLAAAIVTGSVAVLSSLVDSLADVAASTLTFATVRYAQKPPDRGHRFGHGKAEPLSALAQAAFVTGSAAFVLIEGLTRFFRPQPVEAGGWGIAVMLLAVLMTGGLVLYQRRVVRKTASIAIAADSVHYRADLATGIAVIAALALGQYFDWAWLDPLVAVAIAAYLLAHGGRIAFDAVQLLMDRELPPEERVRIKSIVLGHRQVRGMHDLRTRHSGTTKFIELHLELDPQMRVAAAHDVTDAVERDLEAAFPGAEIMIHQEPAGLDDPRLDHRIAQVSR